MGNKDKGGKSTKTVAAKDLNRSASTRRQSDRLQKPSEIEPFDPQPPR